MADTFQIKGAEAAIAKIKSVAKEVGIKGAKAAGTRAMRIVRDAARSKAKTFDDPASPSNIAKNIVTRVNTKAGKRVGGVVVQVGVAGGARPVKGNSDTGHWRLLEFGTSHMPAQPFMRPALSENVQAVTTEFINQLEPQIDKALAKAKR